MQELPAAEVFRLMQLGLNEIFPVDRGWQRRRCKKAMRRMLKGFRANKSIEVETPTGLRVNAAFVGPLLMKARCGACLRKCKHPPA